MKPGKGLAIRAKKNVAIETTLLAMRMFLMLKLEE